jgi:hypothetical protein
VNDPDTPETTTNSINNTIREIPPVRRTERTSIPAIPPVESIPDQIKKLAELRDAGILTEQEFATKKTELLKRM